MIHIFLHFEFLKILTLLSKCHLIPRNFENKVKILRKIRYFVNKVDLKKETKLQKLSQNHKG